MTTSTAQVRDMLSSMGMPPNLTGFEMCAEAIAMAAMEPQMLRAVTGRLYPDIAQKFGTTPSRTEKCIRTAITKLYDMAQPEQIEKYVTIPCHYDSGKATNSTFIAAIARYIRDSYETEAEQINEIY